MLTVLREKSRRMVFQCLQKISATADARAMGNSTLKGLLQWRP